jgi:hypothetical protein
MREETARARFACPACGGDAAWHPQRRMLVCTHCGTASPAPDGAMGAIVEHDLGAALAALAGAPRGWDAQKRSVRCQSCRAVSVLDAARQAQHCEFCGAAQLVDYTDEEPAFRPGSVLPFAVGVADARERIRRWYGQRWLAPSALRRKALTDTVHGVYLPYWTFDARADARWTAEAGHYYYETEMRLRDGRPRAEQVRKVRWTPASGTLTLAFDDDLVCASVGVKPALVRGIEPFPTADLVPYDPAFVAGWVVERYQVELPAAVLRARETMQQKLLAACAARVPGDTQRNLRVSADWSRQTFKHVLVPVWLLTYDYGRNSYQCAMNGVTGRIEGEYPKSAWKIAALVVAVLVFLAVLASLGGR